MMVGCPIQCFKKRTCFVMEVSTKWNSKKNKAIKNLNAEPASESMITLDTTAAKHALKPNIAASRVLWIMLNRMTYYWNTETSSANQGTRWAIGLISWVTKTSARKPAAKAVRWIWLSYCTQSLSAKNALLFTVSIAFEEKWIKRS